VCGRKRTNFTFQKTLTDSKVPLLAVNHDLFGEKKHTYQQADQTTDKSFISHLSLVLRPLSVVCNAVILAVHLLAASVDKPQLRLSHICVLVLLEFQRRRQNNTKQTRNAMSK